VKGWKTGTMLAAASAAALSQAALAQQATPQTTAQAGQPAAGAATDAVRKFEPAFFARYSPVTAFDMVRQLPGFSIDNGDSLRGFGATAGNVLIDGQRPSSKNSISDELQRIAARDVARIELIGAASAGDVDVRGYTELANVVLKPAPQMQTSSTWRGDLVWQGERLSVRASDTMSWKTQDLGVRLNVQAFNQGQREETTIDTRDAAGAPTFHTNEFSQQVFSELLVNASVNWTPTPQDTLNVTGRLTPRLFTRRTGQLRFTPAGALNRLTADDYTEKDILHAELGGDWEHKFSPQNSLKGILVNRSSTWRPQEFFETFSPTGSRTSASIFNTEMKTGEHVARGVWTLKPDDRHTVEIGIEGAFNYLDQHRAIDDLDVTTGVFGPRTVLVPNTRVEEVRAEASINDTWRIDPKLTLELGFTYEDSTITQSGDFSQEHSYTYPKPRLVATWTPTKEDQIRASVERTVAQLSFSEFAGNVVPNLGTRTEGNPDLRPQQVWETQLQWKRSVGERGSISLTGYYHQIDDTQDLMPIRPAQLQGAPPCDTNPNDNACVFTAAGNIGEGERYGIRLEASLPLDSVGVKGGILKIFGEARDSKVTDPITGLERRIANQFAYDWNIDFRQDLPDLKLSWGGDYSSSGNGETFRLNEQQVRAFGTGDLDLFIETTAIKGITLRFSADNIGDMPRYLDRRFFTPNRLPGGVFSGSEYRESLNGPVYGIVVSGAF
jgi:outer membrane receptor for ferrienterochelin and colicin